MRRRSCSTAGIVVALAVLVSISACNGSSGSSADHATTTSTKPTTPAGTSSATAATDPNSSPKRAQKAQIRKGDLPGFNAEWDWTDTRMLRSATSLCMRGSMVAIGAVNQVSTKFTSVASQTASAVQITAVFPDEHTALTTTAVLTAWHNKCARHATNDLGLKQVKVSDLRDVSTPVGTAKQWMVTYRPVPGEPESVWFNSEGFVRDGDTITYLFYKSAGQDYNYELGQEPIDRALAVAGTYLKRTRGR